jgi:nucleoside-diphosphate-sugar epimerase
MANVSKISGLAPVGYLTGSPWNGKIRTYFIPSTDTNNYALASDLTTLQRAVTEAMPDIVIHMAAQPLVRYSYAHPVETYSTNVMGTVHVLESMRALD